MKSVYRLDRFLASTYQASRHQCKLRRDPEPVKNGSPGQVEVNSTTRDGAAFKVKLDIRTSAAFSGIESALQSATGVHPVNQRVRLSDTGLKRLAIARALGIPKSQAVEFQVAKDESQVFVRGLDGRTLVFPIPLSATAVELKNAIRSKTGIRPRAQGLTFAGQVLRGNKMLADYNIARDATITLSLRLRGGVDRPSSAEGPNFTSPLTSSTSAGAIPATRADIPIVPGLTFPTPAPSASPPELAVPRPASAIPRTDTTNSANSWIFRSALPPSAQPKTAYNARKWAGRLAVKAAIDAGTLDANVEGSDVKSTQILEDAMDAFDRDNCFGAYGEPVASAAEARQHAPNRKNHLQPATDEQHTDGLPLKRPRKAPKHTTFGEAEVVSATAVVDLSGSVCSAGQFSTSAPTSATSPQPSFVTTSASFPSASVSPGGTPAPSAPSTSSSPTSLMSPVIHDVDMHEHVEADEPTPTAKRSKAKPTKAEKGKSKAVDDESRILEALKQVGQQKLEKLATPSPRFKKTRQTRLNTADIEGSKERRRAQYGTRIPLVRRLSDLIALPTPSIGRVSVQGFAPNRDLPDVLYKFAVHDFPPDEQAEISSRLGEDDYFAGSPLASHPDFAELKHLNLQVPGGRAVTGVETFLTLGDLLMTERMVEWASQERVSLTLIVREGPLKALTVFVDAVNAHYSARLAGVVADAARPRIGVLSGVMSGMGQIHGKLLLATSRDGSTLIVMDGSANTSDIGFTRGRDQDGRSYRHGSCETTTPQLLPIGSKAARSVEQAFDEALEDLLEGMRLVAGSNMPVEVQDYAALDPGGACHATEEELEEIKQPPPDVTVAPRGTSTIELDPDTVDRDTDPDAARMRTPAQLLVSSVGDGGAALQAWHRVPYHFPARPRKSRKKSVGARVAEAPLSPAVISLVSSRTMSRDQQAAAGVELGCLADDRLFSLGINGFGRKSTVQGGTPKSDGGQWRPGHILPTCGGGDGGAKFAEFNAEAIRGERGDDKDACLALPWPLDDNGNPLPVPGGIMRICFDDDDRFFVIIQHGDWTYVQREDDTYDKSTCPYCQLNGFNAINTLAKNVTKYRNEVFGARGGAGPARRRPLGSSFVTSFLAT
ncbi:hypothetical protein JCM10296v2_002647 [Rhodotorula toruloides]